MSDLLREYPHVFNGLGELGPELHLKVEDDVGPVQFSRRIPEAQRLPLRDHHDKLERDGIIKWLNRPLTGSLHWWWQTRKVVTLAYT